MRILFISERYPPHFIGGYEIACASVAEGLRHRGHQVGVLTSNFSLGRLRDNETGIFRRLYYSQGSPGLTRLAYREIADHKAFRDVVSFWKPDVISAWCML